MDDSAETVATSELNADLSRYLASVKAGKRVAITDEQGEVVAYLEPPGSAHLAPADKPGSAFERLVAAGQVRRATRHGIADLLPIPAAEPGEGSLSEELMRMREEERY